MEKYSSRSFMECSRKMSSSLKNTNMHYCYLSHTLHTVLSFLLFFVSNLVPNPTLGYMSAEPSVRLAMGYVQDQGFRLYIYWNRQHGLWLQSFYTSAISLTILEIHLIYNCVSELRIGTLYFDEILPLLWLGILYSVLHVQSIVQRN